MDYRTQVLFDRKVQENRQLGLDEEMATLLAAHQMNLPEIIEECQNRKRFEQEELRQAAEQFVPLTWEEIQANREGYIIQPAEEILDDSGDISRIEPQIEDGSAATSEIVQVEALVREDDSNGI